MEVQKSGKSGFDDQGRALECRIMDAINHNTTPQELILDVFYFQAEHNLYFKKYLSLLNISPEEVKKVEDLVFFPVELFKSGKVLIGEKVDIVFSSSSTTGTGQSFHHVRNVSLYEHSFRKAFELFYGDASEYVFMGLLPGYSERTGSSLIYMVDHLMKISSKKENGYFLNDFSALEKTMIQLEEVGRKYVLFGVTHALLDFAENYTGPSVKTGVIMETGGMKGRGRELIREELHQFLNHAFGSEAIHSEYGMTELLSQAYATSMGRFHTPSWLKLLVRDATDPLKVIGEGKSGGLNIIDLSNLWSCSFLMTQDLGTVYNDGSFEVIGRFDNSDIRGCNLMYTG